MVRVSKFLPFLVIFLLSLSIGAASLEGSGESGFSEEIWEGTAVDELNLTDVEPGDDGFDDADLGIMGFDGHVDTPETGHIVELESGGGEFLMDSMELQGFDVGVEFENVMDGFVVHGLQEEDIESFEGLSNVENVYEEEIYYPQVSEGIETLDADNLDNGEEGPSGEDVTIAVIDTGVDYTHPDLGGCTTDEFLNDDCEKVVGGYDFVDDEEDPMDSHGHGTHVAGISSADGDLQGVAPGSDVLAYRVLSGQGGSSGDVIAAIDQAVDDDADILGLSLGGPSDPDDALSSAVDDASEDALVVVAAGNDGEDLRTIGSPGTARDALTVGATDYQGDVTDFSSRGPVKWFDNGHKAINKPDVVAPGADINSTVPGDSYDEFDGTSMATPMVSGVAALFMEENPDYDGSEVKSMIKSSAETSEDAYPWREGSGLVNAEQLLEKEGLIVESISFEHIESDTDESITVDIENPSDEELNLDYGFGTIYNVTDLEDVQETGVDPDTEGQVSVDSGDTEQLELTLNLPEGYYSGYFWLNETSGDFNDARGFATAVGDLQEGTKVSASLTDGPDPVYPLVSYLHNESDIVTQIPASGDPVGVEPGTYTYVAGYNVGFTDFLLGTNTNFIYVEEFTVDEDERHHIEQDVSELDSLTFDNTFNGDDLFLQSTTLYYEKNDVNVSLPNNLASIARTGEVDLMYGGNLENLDSWSFGAASRSFEEDWDGEVLLDGQFPFIQLTDKYLTDLTYSSEFFIDRWSFDGEPAESNIDFDFANQETDTIENQDLYRPQEHPLLDLEFTYTETEGDMEIITNPYTMFPQETTVHYEGDVLESYDPGGMWEGPFSVITEDISVGDDLGGLPGLVHDISWEDDELSYSDGLIGHENSVFYTESEGYKVEWEIEDDSGSWSNESVDYWHDFSRGTSGDVEFNLTIPSDLDLQSETRVSGVLEDEGLLPRVTGFDDYSAVSSEGWSTEVTFSGDEATANVREPGSDWTEEDTSQDNLNLDLDPKDSVDLKVEIVDGDNHVNYTFENIAEEKQELDVSASTDDEEEYVEGNVIGVDSLLLDNLVDGEVEDQELAVGGFEFPKESCSYFSQRFQGDQVINYHLNHTFQEAIDFNPTINYEDKVYYSNNNALEFVLTDLCDFNFELEINDSGSFENRSVTDVDEEVEYNWTNTYDLEDGTVSFRLWGEQDDEWFSSNTENFEVLDLDDALNVTVDLDDTFLDLTPTLDWEVDMVEETLDIPELEDVSYEIELIKTSDDFTVIDETVEETEFEVADNLVIGEEYRLEVKAVFNGDETQIHSDTFIVDEDIELTVDEDIDVGESVHINVGENGEVLTDFENLEVYIERDDQDWSESFELKDEGLTWENGSFVPRRESTYNFEFELELPDQSNVVREEDREVELDQEFIVDELVTDKSARPLVNDTFDMEFVMEEFYADSADLTTDLDYSNLDFGLESLVDPISGESYDLIDDYVLENVSSEEAGDFNVELEATSADSDSTEETITEEVSFYEPKNVTLNIDSDINGTDTVVRLKDPETVYNKSVDIDRENFTVPDLFSSLNYSYSFEHRTENFNLTLNRTGSDFKEYLNVTVVEESFETEEDIIHQLVDYSDMHNFSQQSLGVEKKVESEDGENIRIEICSSFEDGDCNVEWNEVGWEPKGFFSQGDEVAVDYSFNDVDLDAYRIRENKPSDDDDENDDNGGGGTGWSGPVGGSGPAEEDFVEPGIETIDGGFEVVGLENARQEDFDIPGSLTVLSNLEFEAEESHEESVWEFTEEEFSDTDIDLVFYEGVNIHSQNLTVDDVEVRFNVSRNWIEDKEAQPTDVTLYERNSLEDDWGMIDTNVEVSGDIDVEFSADISQSGDYAVGTLDPCPPIEVRAVDEELEICRLYTSECDLPSDYTEVNSCDNWRERQEIQQILREFTEASTETGETAQEETLERDEEEEEILEEAEEALEAGDLDQARQLAQNLEETDDEDIVEETSIINPLLVAGGLVFALFMILAFLIVKGSRDNDFSVPEAHSPAGSKPPETDESNVVKVGRNPEKSVKIRSRLVEITDKIKREGEVDPGVVDLLEEANQAREDGNYVKAESLIETIEERLDYV